jgi:hypothetical protein
MAPVAAVGRRGGLGDDLELPLPKTRTPGDLDSCGPHPSDSLAYRSGISGHAPREKHLLMTLNSTGSRGFRKEPLLPATLAPPQGGITPAHHIQASNGRRGGEATLLGLLRSSFSPLGTRTLGATPSDDYNSTGSRVPRPGPCPIGLAMKIERSAGAMRSRSPKSVGGGRRLGLLHAGTLFGAIGRASPSRADLMGRAGCIRRATLVSSGVRRRRPRGGSKARARPRYPSQASAAPARPTAHARRPPSAAQPPRSTQSFAISCTTCVAFSIAWSDAHSRTL